MIQMKTLMKMINENLIANVPNDEFNEKQSETLPLQLENTNYTEINDKKMKKNKGGMRKRIVSYILVGVICSTLGGVGSGIVTMNMMKNTSNTATTTTAPKATTTNSSSDAKAKLITTNSTDKFKYT